MIHDQIRTVRLGDFVLDKESNKIFFAHEVCDRSVVFHDDVFLYMQDGKEDIGYVNCCKTYPNKYEIMDSMNDKIKNLNFI